MNTPPYREPLALQDEDISRSPARFAMWGTTWLSYLTYYFGRKGIAVAKTSINESLGSNVLVGVDTAFLAAYAIGQYVNGFLGDRVGARWLVSIGMLVSAAACLAFGFGSGAVIFLVAFFVNGLAQSSGWPGNVKAMAEWTTPTTRGRVMGLWASCYQVGGIIASLFATWMMALYGWRAAFWGPALVLAAVGILVLVVVRSPRKADLGAAAATVAKAADAKASRAAQLAVLRNPRVYAYGLSYFFIKLIRYSLLFWLPTYLSTVLHYSKIDAGFLSTSFEVGGLVGTIVLGLLSDHFRRWSRVAWAFASLAILPFAFLLYLQIGSLGFVPNFIAMGLVGILLFGPDSILSGAAAQDAGGPKGAAIAAGWINGIGSLGAIFQELVTKGLSSWLGWDALFKAFILFAVLSALTLIPVLKRSPPTD